MTEPVLLREVDGAEYLDRQSRMKAALARFDQAAMADIIDEVEPLPLVVGRRYRLRVLGGAPTETIVRHVEDETGRRFHLEHPGIASPEFLEVEGVMEQRLYGIPGRRSPGSFILRLADGRGALHGRHRRPATRGAR